MLRLAGTGRMPQIAVPALAFAAGMMLVCTLFLLVQETPVSRKIRMDD